MQEEGVSFPVLGCSLAQQAVATALESPDPIAYVDVLATGSPWDRWLLQDSLAAAPSSPSTPLLQYRWLLQDLTPAVCTAVSSTERPAVAPSNP